MEKMKTPIIPHNYYEPADRTVFASAVVLSNGHLTSKHTVGEMLDKDSRDWDRLEVHSQVFAVRHGIEEAQTSREIIIYSKEKGVPV